MITYAAAGDAMIAGGHLTPAFVNAIRNAKLRNMELACNQLSIANEDTKRSLEITRELVKEKPFASSVFTCRFTVINCGILPFWMKRCVKMFLHVSPNSF